MKKPALTHKERMLIEQYQKEGCKVSEIAKRLKRAERAIYYECKRGCLKENYPKNYSYKRAEEKLIQIVLKEDVLKNEIIANKTLSRVLRG